MEFSDETRGFLKERLNQAGISTAVVIDDAFDPPTLSSLEGEVSDFWNLIERDDELREQLESFGIPAESEDDITEETIAVLWSRRKESTPLVDHANRTLFAVVAPAFDSVERIADFLQELGLEVDRVGTDDFDPPPVAGLVFMDHYLGDPSNPSSSELSASRAREIYDAPSEDEDKPFIILMSSLPEVSSQAEKFREDSDLLGGLFDFASKDELTNPTQFAIRLATWTSNMPIRHKIQEFIESLDSFLGDRIREFMKEAKSLTIEDYAFVQALSLQDDGHPLGDYMQWLFSSLLVHKVLEENDSFTDRKEEVNKMSADFQPLSQLFPSTQLAEIYSIAIAERELGEIERHQIGTNTTQENLPKLRLGDLLVHDDGRRVYMIATPDCDLQFAPDAGRMPEEGESVMLVPGELRPLREPIRQGQIQTELYLHDGEQRRIAWERKKIDTVAVANFIAWCTENGYSRPARLRLPYAVKIQQEVIAGLSRVGMPVAPPLLDFVPVEVYYEGSDGTWEQLGSALDPGVNVIFTGNSTQEFVLNPVALRLLLEATNKLIDRYTLYVQEETDGGRKQRLANKLKDLRKCVEEPEKLVPMLEATKKLPKSGGLRQLLADTIVLHRNGDFSAPCNRRHIVCLNIVYG